MDDCVFCKMASGEIPVRALYEDERVMAFDDISPQAPVHALVIPKAHFGSLSDDVPADVLAALLSGVREVARIKGVDSGGYRVIVNNGADANQTVGHLHVHVMGGARMTHGMVRFDDE